MLYSIYRPKQNSYSVFDSMRFNEDGEHWCVAAFVTSDQAKDCIKHPAKYDSSYIGYTPIKDLTDEQIWEYDDLDDCLHRSVSYGVCNGCGRVINQHEFFSVMRD